MRWAWVDSFNREQSTPDAVSRSISARNVIGSTTTPLPITGTTWSYNTPDGMSCRANRCPLTTSVWPALWPPWYRTTSAISLAMVSVTLPLPSSPHCVPTTTVAGMPSLPFARRIAREP